MPGPTHAHPRSAADPTEVGCATAGNAAAAFCATLTMRQAPSAPVDKLRASRDYWCTAPPAAHCSRSMCCRGSSGPQAGCGPAAAAHTAMARPGLPSRATAGELEGTAATQPAAASLQARQPLLAAPCTARYCAAGSSRQAGHHRGTAAARWAQAGAVHALQAQGAAGTTKEVVIDGWPISGCCRGSAMVRWLPCVLEPPGLAPECPPHPSPWPTGPAAGSYRVPESGCTGSWDCRLCSGGRKVGLGGSSGCSRAVGQTGPQTLQQPSLNGATMTEVQASTRANLDRLSLHGWQPDAECNSVQRRQGCGCARCVCHQSMRSAPCRPSNTVLRRAYWPSAL